MKKKIDTTFFVSNLRGEFVFFLTKNDKSLLEQAEEPIGNQRPAQSYQPITEKHRYGNSSFDANKLIRENASTRTRVNANTLGHSSSEVDTTKRYFLSKINKIF